MIMIYYICQKWGIDMLSEKTKKFLNILACIGCSSLLLMLFYFIFLIVVLISKEAFIEFGWL